MKGINIVGAGLSGLYAAMTLARMGIHTNLISSLPSERAQSVLAEGGINSALDTMGENDTIDDHFYDTKKGGCFIESDQAIYNLVSHAPDIVKELYRLGVPFQSIDGQLILRNFGGQAHKRTAYAKSSTGKVIMTALIDEVRKYEAQGLVTRYAHHDLIDMTIKNHTLEYIIIRDNYTEKYYKLTGITLLCTGGLNGFFEGMTTGTTVNTGNSSAIAFSKGVTFSDLEFIQYHPTTVSISHKRMLISEAARGEGGRLYILRDDKPWYFMEEKYPELGNLMPRDVVSREMVLNSETLDDIYLDMHEIDKEIWESKLSDMREEILSYLHIDPMKEAVPVSPGIHYFMGGIKVNDAHQTNIKGLYASGEATSKYHGANRLGGNSMLGAMFGGYRAALSMSHEVKDITMTEVEYDYKDPTNSINIKITDILKRSLSMIRDEDTLIKGIDELEKLDKTNPMDHKRIILAKGMILCALHRKESRGAHYRKDYPESRDEYKKISVISYDNDYTVSFIDMNKEDER